MSITSAVSTSSPTVYRTFHVDHQLAAGMALHFLFMWIFTINGVLYFAYTIFSGEWKFLVPRSRRAFRDAFDVMLYDLHLRKGVAAAGEIQCRTADHLHGIALMGVGSVLTGRDLQTHSACLAYITFRRL